MSKVQLWNVDVANICSPGDPAAGVSTVYGCEGATVSLACQGSRVLRVVRANYGRFSISVCNPLALSTLDTGCSSEEATSVLLARRCQGRPSCQVQVSQEHLPQVCPDTSKYLEVTCHLSPVTCHLSPVTCHLSPVTCHQG